MINADAGVNIITREGSPYESLIAADARWWDQEKVHGFLCAALNTTSQEKAISMPPVEPRPEDIM